MDAPRAHNGAVDNEMNDEQLVCYPPRCDNAVTSAVFSSVCVCVGRSVCVCVCVRLWTRQLLSRLRYHHVTFTRARYRLSQSRISSKMVVF